MHDLRVFVFDTFLKSPMQLQTTRSPRLLNGFWCFLVQNEEEILLVLFLFSTVHFRWVENDENFERSKTLFFFFKFLAKKQVFHPSSPIGAHDLWWAICLRKYRNTHYWKYELFCSKTNYHLTKFCEYEVKRTKRKVVTCIQLIHSKKPTLWVAY